jgi:hypothetical protein
MVEVVDLRFFGNGSNRWTDREGNEELGVEIGAQN